MCVLKVLVLSDTEYGFGFSWDFSNTFLYILCWCRFLSFRMVWFDLAMASWYSWYRCEQHTTCAMVLAIFMCDRTACSVTQENIFLTRWRAKEDGMSKAPNRVMRLISASAATHNTGTFRALIPPSRSQEMHPEQEKKPIALSHRSHSG